ncbi:MAG: TatD family hydrolase [Burkholderiales bacterium]|jgi:TatD DNase family protein|nr:TatD family hydrolase [Burkholderiales bacterium]
MPEWIDTHAHLDAPEFGGSGEAVMARARHAGVTTCVLPAVKTGNFDEVRELAHRGGGAYALGIHPLCTGDAGEGDIAVLEAALRAHAGDPRLVAVGEIGLDYFEPLDDERQTFIYREQLKLARDHDLPVILHVRRSADRVLKGLRDVAARSHRWLGIAHAFNGSEQQAQAFIDLGFKLGFGGAVTFERALQLRRLAATLPLSSLVMETDSPDIAPHWLYRTAQQRAAGEPQGRNEPAELPRIAAVVAQLRGIGIDELAEATGRNAREALPRLAQVTAATR